MTTQAYKERIIPKDQKIQSTHQEIFDAIVADDRAKFEDLTTDLPQPDISFSIPADDKTHPMLLNKPTIPNLCCLLGAKNILAYVEQQPAFHLDKKDEKGRTCVHFTAATGDLNMLQILLGNDLKLDPLDNDGNNACHYAAKFDNIEIFKYLYMNGIDLNHRNQDGQSPFIWAAANNSCEVLKFIISVQNGKELAVYYTPVHYAAATGSLEALQILIQNGADYDLENDISFFLSHKNIFIFNIS